MPLRSFHPAIATWFARRFGTPTTPQLRGWPLLRENRHTLIAAPTGSGKTMAAFLVFIDRLVKLAEAGDLGENVQVVYVSPLKALSHDIKKNLDEPLAEIATVAKELGLDFPEIRVAVRTGDTTAGERAKMLKNPPHILVTTPESLYLLLTAPRGRTILTSATTVIVDEIHALARDKRGSHLMLSLARLDHLAPTPLTRVGLSATQKPLERVARFLTNAEPCEVLDCGGLRDLDLAVEMPATPLSAVCSHEQWEEVDDRLCALINEHQSTLIFVNTRKLAERLSFQLTERLGEEAVACHHGSLAREKRLDVEARLKNGQLKAIVATASLELGIDIGFVDLVCQIGSPRSLATFLQRVGRSGHSRYGKPKGRLFALTREELVECYGLIRGARAGKMDEVEIPSAPIDILLQQIVAMTAAEPWSEEDLLDTLRRASPYADLTMERLHGLLKLLNDGMAEGTRAGTYIFWDRIEREIKPRRHARLSAITSGGAIPEQNLYRVVTSDTETFVGTLDEDFAIESNRGDIFQLGNTSWQVEAVRDGKVFVHDAHGAPSSIPFWIGEAPGRTYELSDAVSDLRLSIARLIPEDYDGHGNLPAKALQFLKDECAASPEGAEQALNYLASQIVATGRLPSQTDIVLERFFDETGGMQIVLHAPFGTRINRAWGLAFRKCFCRGFDFELQASASDNGIVLSVGPNQSFSMQALLKLLSQEDGRDVLVQALLASPMFGIRWRWNVTRALAVLRQRKGRKVPPHMQRFQAEDLLTAAFPAQTQCFEHRTGDLEVPEHPLVQQTVHDCLTEAMDLTRWEKICAAIRDGTITVHTIDTREPSPFSYELLTAGPYAFLDDAPLEERRTRAVANRRWLDPADVKDLCALSPEAIRTVKKDAWPLVRDEEELYDALRQLIILPIVELGEWRPFFDTLVAKKRALIVAQGGREWAAALECLPHVEALFPGATLQPRLSLPPHLADKVEPEAALTALVRGQMECRGPTTAEALAELCGSTEEKVKTVLMLWESRGVVLSGRFTPELGKEEWCERRLLARIHQLTIDGLRDQIKPVTPATFWSYLCHHQHAAEENRLHSEDGCLTAITQLAGFEAAAGAWENELLATRLQHYDEQFLDRLTLSGQVMWGRINDKVNTEDRKKAATLNKSSPLCLMPREHWDELVVPPVNRSEEHLSHAAQTVMDALRKLGAVYARDLVKECKLLPVEVENALGELVVEGFVSNDSFAAIRPQITPWRTSGLRAAGQAAKALQSRWWLIPYSEAPSSNHVAAWARQLLERYGVVFRDLLQRENHAPSWRELAIYYRQWELRGEIRGGRFVTDVAGEQFALPDAIPQLRAIPQRKKTGGWVVLSGNDPLNLAGILSDDLKIPALRTSRLVVENGKMIACRVGGDVQFFGEYSPEKKNLLTRAMTLTGRFRSVDPFLKEGETRRPAGFRGGVRNWREIFSGR